MTRHGTLGVLELDPTGHDFGEVNVLDYGGDDGRESSRTGDSYTAP